MRGEYASDRDWADRHLPEVKSIIGPLLLRPAPLDEDPTQATDLRVLLARDMRIAVRLRRSDRDYADRYPFDYTIRSDRPNGARTEPQKITDGWGDWFFYGHTAPAPKIEIIRWMVVDLRAHRAHLIRNRQAIRGVEKTNWDGTKFVAFDIRSFPADPPILIASSFEFPPKPTLNIGFAGASTQPDLFV